MSLLALSNAPETEEFSNNIFFVEYGMRKKIVQFILNTPMIIWVIGGFLVPYLFFYFNTLFFETNFMRIDPYLPAIEPIGADIRAIIDYSSMWILNRENPYEAGYMYPPFSMIFFSPLVFMPEQVSYIGLSFLTIAAYTVAIVMILKKYRDGSYFIAAIVFVTGLFSYPLHFEIERGQYNFIVFFLCYVSIHFFYNSPKYRYFGYLLFTLAVQLKVYPFIFCLMFLYDWRNWRRDLKLLIALATVNVVFLGALGPAKLSNFLNAIGSENAQDWVWKGNHSILSFLTWLKILLVENYQIREIREYVKPLEYLFLSITCIVVLVATGLVYVKKEKKMDMGLFFILTLAAMLIPGVSHDYKIPILFIPFSMLLMDLEKVFISLLNSAFKLYLVGFLFVVSTLFFSLTYSYIFKPFILQNNFPVLFLLLLVCGIHQVIMYIHKKNTPILPQSEPAT